MANVVSNIAPVLKGFLDIVTSCEPDMKYVYDEKLSYETGTAKFRQDNQIAKDEIKSFPLLIFRRSVLKYPEAGIQRRGGFQRGLVQSGEIPKLLIPDGEGIKPDFMQGELEVNFLYTDHRINQIENFEIRYLTETGFSKSKKFSIDFPDFDCAFEYHIEFNPLEDKLIEKDGNYYKQVEGSAKIRGMFFTIRDEGNSKVIKSIETNIKNAAGETLVNCLATTP